MNGQSGSSITSGRRSFRLASCVGMLLVCLSAALTAGCESLWSGPPEVGPSVRLVGHSSAIAGPGSWNCRTQLQRLHFAKNGSVVCCIRNSPTLLGLPRRFDSSVHWFRPEADENWRMLDLNSETKDVPQDVQASPHGDYIAVILPDGILIVDTATERHWRLEHPAGTITSFTWLGPAEVGYVVAEADSKGRMTGSFLRQSAAKQGAAATVIYKQNAVGCGYGIFENWSPDGRFVLVRRGDDYHYPEGGWGRNFWGTGPEVFLLSVRTGQATDLGQDTRVGQFVWSRDGQTAVKMEEDEDQTVRTIPTLHLETETPRLEAISSDKAEPYRADLERRWEQFAWPMQGPGYGPVPYLPGLIAKDVHEKPFFYWRLFRSATRAAPVEDLSDIDLSEVPGWIVFFRWRKDTYQGWQVGPWYALNPATGQRVELVVGPTGRDTWVLSPDGRWIAMVAKDGRVWIGQVDLSPAPLKPGEDRTD